MSLTPSLADLHTKVRRTSGNLDRWEARYDVTTHQTFQFHGEWHIVTTTARVGFACGEDRGQYAELEVQRIGTTDGNPEWVAYKERELARNDLARKFNNWVQVQDELAAMDDYLATEGGES